MPARAIVYLKAGITAVLLGHPEEPCHLGILRGDLAWVDEVLGMG